MRILLTGGSGLLGRSVQRWLLAAGNEVIAPGHAELDITDIDCVERYITNIQPDQVVHCAAYSKVELAEREEALCRKINVTGTSNIAQVCRQLDRYLLHISTDYVFNGEKQGYYDVDDDTSPISAYGRSKADSEKAVLAARGRSCILRTSWMFGEGGKNFVATILQLGSRHESINVVCDQIGSPTYSEDLACLITDVCKCQTVGIIHGTNEGVCSWAQFAGSILRMANFRCKVTPVLSSEYPSEAARPKNSKLNKECLDKTGLNRLPSWEDALARYMKCHKVS